MRRTSFCTATIGPSTWLAREDPPRVPVERLSDIAFMRRFVQAELRPLPTVSPRAHRRTACGEWLPQLGNEAEQAPDCTPPR